MQKIASIFLAFIFMASLCAQAEQEEGLEFLLFAEIPTITGISKAEETFNEIPMSAYVVSNDELDRWGVRSLYEIFQRVPGYSFYNTDYYGQYGPIGRGLQSVWRYGFSFELMNVVDFGHLTFTPHFFKNIEVARGPAGLMWGSGAEAGLLNFNIRDDLNGLETVTELGNENRRAFDVMYGGKFNEEGDGFFVGWHYEEQDAVLQENAFDVPGEQWKMNGIAPSQLLLGKLKYKDFKFIFTQDHAKHIAPKIWFTDQYKELLSTLETIQDDVGDNLEIVAYRAQYHLPIENENFSLYFYHDYYKKQWWFESVALDTQRKRSFGFNSELKLFQDRWNINLGSTLWGEDKIFAPSHTSDFARPYGITWYDSNFVFQDYEWKDVFLQTRVNITEQLKFILGGRLDYQKDAEDENLFTGPRIAILYTPVQEITFKYLYNSSKRRPQGNEAAQGLSHETLEAHEIVTIYEIPEKFRFDLTLFTQDLSDQITRQNINQALNAFVNTGGLESKGVEWSLKLLPTSNLVFYWNGTWIDAEVKEGSVGGVTVSEAHFSDGRPLFVPEITSFLGAEISLLETVRVNLALRSIYNIPYLNVLNQEEEADINFIDLTLRTKGFGKHKVEVSISALNLLDEDERVPAFGEHSGNTTGTLEPEGLRYYLRVGAVF